MIGAMPSAPDMAFALAIALLTVLVATSWLRLHPFLVLIATAYAVAFASGLSLAQVSGAVEDGFGAVMSSIGIVIFASGIIGASLERSGAALVLADATMRVVGEKRPALAFNVTGYFISIPVFCDAGFALLAPLTRAIASRTATSITVLAVALATGLYATHSLVPPTPGPLAAALTLKANVGLTAGLGLLVAIPVALVGLAWAYIVDRLGHGTVSSLKPDYVRWDDLIASKGPLPSLAAALAPILLPLGLIAIGTLAGWSADAGASALSRFLIFLGNPSTALLLGALASLALKRERGNALEGDWIMEGLKNSGAVLAVTGAGGALSHALAMTAAGQALARTISEHQLGVLAPFLIASVFKIAQGSTTVAMVASSAIVAPLIGPLGYTSEMGRALLVLAVASGAMVVSHVNDSYFWVVAQGSGIPVSTAYRSQTLATLVQGTVALLIVWGLSIFLL
jgi:gluconate:H+ symporter, GntP family